MKNLILINGTMGVGKTAVSKILLKLLPHCVFLDGDWCWNADPLIVNDETKYMVEKNINYLLGNFLTCTAYQNVIFCWVIHEESIFDPIIPDIQDVPYELFKFSLICSENALRKRLQKDILNGVRERDIRGRSLSRLPHYLGMDTIKIDVSDITPKQAADSIYNFILTSSNSSKKQER